MRPRTGIALLLLGLLAVLAYAPSLTLPLMEDDYPNLAQTLNSGLATPLADPIFRVRATSYGLMWLLWRWAGVAPLKYHVASLLLHIANTWLLYGVCVAWPRMRAAAFWAAGFFAVAEGHQEAVMWFSAVNELWLFLFGMGALLCFLRRRTLAGVALFAMALLSKESAAAVLPLFLLVTPAAEWRGAVVRQIVRLAPYALLAAVAVASVFATRSYSFRFSDGSFSLHAPFWITWPHSYFRILWIWGLVAGASIPAARDGALRRSALVALAWIGIALAPYSFLTYSTAIPSRQTYLASAGLAMLFGLTMAWWWEKLRMRRRWLVALVALVVAHNVGYLWFRKRPQFLARAEPTVQLIALARRTPGPIWMRCFPGIPYGAEEAVHLAAGYAPGNLIWTREEAERRHPTAVFCFEKEQGGPQFRQVPVALLGRSIEGRLLCLRRSLSTAAGAPQSEPIPDLKFGDLRLSHRSPQALAGIAGNCHGSLPKIASCLVPAEIKNELHLPHGL